MKNDKFHIYLDDDEYRQVVQCLISLKNALIEQGRYTEVLPVQSESLSAGGVENKYCGLYIIKSRR